MVKDEKEEKQCSHRKNNVDQCIFCFLKVLAFPTVYDKEISRVNNHQNYYASTHISEELGNLDDEISCLRCKVLLTSNIIDEINNLHRYQSKDHINQIFC